MDPEKLEVIKEWPVPKNIHELRSFIGMCAYYCCFIANFSSILGPLHDLTKKNVWQVNKRKHSLCSKKSLSLKPVLVLPDLMIRLKSNVMPVGHSLEVVLLQEGHTIAYKSMRLNDHEKNLDIYEKEI